jgi:glycosyltransferase involved in cell wall biosynthesis
MADNGLKLSILICSVDRIERQESLNKLIHELNSQIASNYAENIVEVLIETDNGTMSVGQKRNLLIEKAQGEYICFIDDDDFISKNYLNVILQNLNKDICLIRIDHIVNGERTKAIQTSLYIHYLETAEVLLKANHLHLCPHKKSKAVWTKFLHINFAEDLDYSQRLIPELDTYNMVEEPIYIYNDNLPASLTRNV